MAKKDLYTKRVYEIVEELKIPLIDERLCESTVIREAAFGSIVTFRFELDESTIRNFLGLCIRYDTVVIKKKDLFYIPTSSILFKLENA
jgi:hypothetical protein